MRWKVVLEAEIDEGSVEGALAETMMIARSLANHPEVWPRDGGVDRWTFDSSKDEVWKDRLAVKCTVQKVTP